MRFQFLPLFLCLGAVAAQDAPPLPDRVKTLQANYEAAIARATAPLTKAYLQELERLRAEFTSAGNLQSALAAETLIKQVTARESGGAPAALGDVPLSKMTIEQFKRWLAGVVISEQSRYMNIYTFDGTMISSTKEGTRTPREHPDASIEVGRIFVPFTSTNATIHIDPSMTKAEVSYSTGGKYEATIAPKLKR